MRFRIAFATLVVSTLAISAADWPQWRGPNRDGVSLETGLLKVWPKDGPKLLWKVEELPAMGTGYGSPAVIGDKLFIMGSTGGEKVALKETCTCLSTKDGSKIWQTVLSSGPGSFSANYGNCPHSTPTVDGALLYVLGVTGDLTCLSTEKGELKWTKNFVKDFGGKIPTWGFSESVLIDGDHLICTPGNAGGMIALDKKTGATVWQCKEFKDGAGYSAIVAVEIGGVRQYVQQTMSSALGVRAKDGKLLWKVGEIGRRIAVIPTPIVEDGYAFFTSGYGAGCECYKLEKDGDGTKATKVYTKNSVVSNHHGGVIRVGDYVYGHSDRNGWVCFDFKKGPDEATWKASGVGKGAVTCAEGMLYCYSERDGTCALVKATPGKEYEEVSRFKIPSTSKIRAGNRVWAHPVIANGKLYLRDYEKLFVFDVSGK